jgi:chromosome segregation ATPase
MDINKRFDQLESLLVDLARKQDQQAAQIAQIIEVLNRQGEAIAQQSGAIAQQSGAIAQQSGAIAQQSEVLARQEVRLDNIGDQIGDIINILKISEGRHTETERRQDAVMAEIKTQSQRQDVAVEALRALLKRQENADSRLDSVVQTQLQMLQLMRADANKLDGQEPRIKRLEDEVFREAS